MSAALYYSKQMTNTGRYSVEFKLVPVGGRVTWIVTVTKTDNKEWYATGTWSLSNKYMVWDTFRDDVIVPKYVREFIDQKLPILAADVIMNLNRLNRMQMSDFKATA